MHRGRGSKARVYEEPAHTDGRSRLSVPGWRRDVGGLCGFFPARAECLDRRSRALCARLPNSMAAGDARIEQSSATHE
jgi:hypothetical protein